MRRWKNLSRACLILISGFLSLDAVALDQFVAPGDTGKINVFIENDWMSPVALENTRIDVQPVSDARFRLERTSSTLGPVSIPSGVSNFFSIQYSIPDGAAEGTFPVLITPASDTEGLSPPFESQTINFTVDMTPPLADAYDAHGLAITHRVGPLGTVTVRATDAVGGSGVYKFSISPPYFEDVVFEGADAVAGGEEASVEYADLENGSYTVTIEDKSRNRNAVQFAVSAPPRLHIIDSIQEGGLRTLGPFSASTVTLANRIWLHNGLKEPAGIRFQATAEGASPALKVIGLDAAGEPDENRLFVDLDADWLTQEVSYEDGTLPDATGYLVSASAASTTTVYFGVDSVPPGVRFGLNVSPTFDVEAVGISTDATSGVAETVFETATSLGIESRIGAGPPGENQIPFQFPLTQQVFTGGSDSFGDPVLGTVGFVIARDVGGLAAAFNPVYISQEGIQFMLGGSAAYPGQWGLVSWPSSIAANRIDSYHATGACVQRNPLPEVCYGSSPPSQCSTLSGSCGSWSLKIRSIGLTPSTTVPITVSGAFIGETQIAGGSVGGMTQFDVSGSPGLVVGATVMARVDIVDGSNPYFTPWVNVDGKLHQLYIDAGINPIAPVISTGIFPSVEVADVRVSFGAVAPGPERRVWISQVPITPPDGQRFIPDNPELAADIATLADVSGGVHVRMRYDGSSLNAAQKAQLKMWHRGPGGWEDVTSLVDVDRSEVSGVAQSASPFAVFVPKAALGEAPASDGSVTFVSSSSVTLTWAPGGNPAGILYFVGYTTSPANAPCSEVPGAPIGVKSVFGETVELGGLAPGTGYRMQVCNDALGAEGCSSPVAVATLEDGQPAQAAPAFLNCDGGQSGPDLTAPVTQLGFAGFSASTAGAAGIINDRSSVTLTAIDDGIGQVRTFYAIDPPAALLSGGLNGGTTEFFWPYSGPFPLLPGTRVVAYGSVDGAGNYELLRSTGIVVEAVIVDTAPPRTVMSFGSPAVTVDSMVYVTNQSFLGLTATDDRTTPGDGLGAGTTQTYYATDAGAFAPFTGSFHLVEEGTHAVSYFSVDLVGNTEAAKIQLLGVDLTPPSAALVSSGTLYALVAEDPVVAGAASGVMGLHYVVDVDPATCDSVEPDAAAPRGTCANTDYAEPFELAAGTHTVSFLAVDRVGNEVFASSYVVVAPPIPALSSLALSPAAASIPAGTSVQFEAAGTFTDGSTRTMTVEVAWTTDLSTVVSVSSTTGLAMGLREGEALVIASSGAVTAQAIVTVTPPLLISLAVTPSTASVAAGLTVQFAAAGTFTDGSTRTMTGEVGWSTDLPTVATVSASGLATSFLEGTALVTVSSGAISAHAVLTVTAPLLVSIAVEPALASIPAGTTIQFTAAGTFTDGSTRTLTGEAVWSTDFSSVARINAVGLSTGAAEGVTRVVALSSGVAGSATLTVTPPAIVSITVTPASATITAETNLQFEAGGAFTDGSTRTITGEVAWTTDAPSVATVVGGLATGQGVGATRVVASLAAVTGAGTLTVTAPPLTMASISPASGITGESVPATVAGTGLDASTALTLERADALRGAWAATGSFAQARYLATLTKLRDGRALLAGGSSGSSAADLYDPATGAWTAAAPLLQGRDQHSAVLLADGRLLVSGGYRSGAPVASVEIYDPARNAWTAAAPMKSPKAWHQLSLLADGRVLAVGGLDASGYLKSVELYDPAADAWSLAAPMAQGRAGAALAALGDGRLLVAGGFGGTLMGEVYDPAANAWTAATGALRSSNYFLQAVTLSNGKVIIAGDPSGSTDMYDPATNALTPAAPLGTARYVHAMVRVSGTAFVIGGENLSATALASTEIYDVAAGAWRPGPALTATRTWPRAAVLDDGRVLVAGGLATSGGARLNTAEVLGAPAAVIAAAGETAPDWRHLTGTLDLTGASTGYWDVVVRRTDGQVGRLNDGFRVLPGAPVLASIAVTPLTATIVTGATVQFAAAGTFTDGSTRTMTGEVGWRTEFSTTATVDPAGLATGQKAGVTRVIASSGAITGSATLTVTAPPLMLASISPASAPAEQAVPAALAGTGFDAATALTLERADALRGTWAATGSYGQARYLSTLTKLRDGRVLLAGGAAGGTSFGSTNADLYDPGTGAWTALPPMRQPRSQHGAVVLADGRVLVAGGYGSGAPVNTVEIYDPGPGTWTLVEPMSYARAWPVLALLPDGRVLAAGGLDAANYLTSSEIYDPAAHAWTPARSMNHGRAGAATATLGGGKILAAGGWGADATCEVYTPGADIWTPTTGGLSAAGYLPHAVALSNGMVLVVGDPGGTTDLYDPATSAFAAAARLGIARYVHAMVRVSGTALVIGGENLSATALASTEVYDVAAGAWRPGPALTAPRTWPRAAVLDDGRVLATGGLAASGGAKLNTAELLGAPAVVIAAAGETAANERQLTATLDLAGAATGYWDVVVRRQDGQSGRLVNGFEVLVPPPALTSIEVTPATATIMAGATAQFAAAGTYADGSTRTITSEVSWATDFPQIATVDAAGLAAGVAGGTARVIASSGAFSAYATLNVAFVATTTTSVNGSPEVTLVSTAPFSVVAASTETGAGAVALGSATIQGLVLVSPVYQVTRQDQGATAVLTWYFDPAVVDPATLAIWRFDGVAWSSATVLNQVVTVSNGVGTVTGEVVLTSLFALFSRDMTAPVTSLLVDGAPAGAERLELAPASAIGFAAVDAGVGVSETRYALDGGAETIFVSPFTLAPGNYALGYRSVDRGGNAEPLRTVEVRVTGPNADAEPPAIRLDFPGASALGVERTVGGLVGVRGSVSDAGAVNWTLEAAPGEAAAEGFTTIASGAGSVSGLIAAWDTASLSGSWTLRLRAIDASDNAASATAVVFVGAPVMTFAAGRKDSDAIVAALKGPAGIAVRADGAVWVTSVENDQVLLISPAGVLLGGAGSAPGQSGEEQARGPKKVQEAPRFKAPQGLALDAAGNLYVADRDTNRVAKLSPDGRSLLLEFGAPGSGAGELKRPFDVAVDANGDVYAADSGHRRVAVFDAAGAFLRQLGAAVFPATSELRGLALTSEGLWVSDKELDVIHLFSRSGTLLKTIGGGDSSVGELSRTRGLAADRLGALYVIEPNRDRVQKFDPRGQGLLAFGTGDGSSRADKLAKRRLTQPVDAAVGPDGSLWIADAGRDRIVRYALPASGAGTAALSTGGGALSSSSVEPARRVVDHQDGAVVSRDDGSGVRVPRGALAADLEITVDKGDENMDKENKEAKRRELKIKAVSEEVQYGPEGTTFNAPVILSLPYDANLITSLGMSENDLKVYYWNPGLKEWQAMPSTVDKKSRTVNALTTHFSAYQVGGAAGAGGIGVAAAVDDFGFRDQYAFPSPSRNGAPVTFRIQPGLADSVSVRVYDLSGRQVHDSADFRFAGAIDDGNGKGNQNTYDHAWSVDGVGSGVYRYVIEAKRAGQTPIVKSGKAGVIK